MVLKVGDNGAICKLLCVETAVEEDFAQTSIFLKVDCLDCYGSYIHLSKYWWIVMYSILCSTDIGNLTQIKFARFSQAIYTFNYRNIFEGRLSCILIYSDTFRHLSLLY